MLFKLVFRGQCSVVCDSGIRNRTRQCNVDSSYCVGSNLGIPACSCNDYSTETQSCNTAACWTHWTECSVFCGGGSRTRVRTCAIPGTCSNITDETSVCNFQPCFEWGEWGDWSSCS